MSRQNDTKDQKCQRCEGSNNKDFTRETIQVLTKMLCPVFIGGDITTGDTVKLENMLSGRTTTMEKNCRASHATQDCHVCLFVGCLTSQQHASVSQGQISTDDFTCCYTEIEVADQTYYLTQSQYTDTGPTSPSADPLLPGAWQTSHGRANF